jgi:hypothetical protein
VTLKKYKKIWIFLKGIFHRIIFAKWQKFATEKITGLE